MKNCFLFKIFFLCILAITSFFSEAVSANDESFFNGLRPLHGETFQLSLIGSQTVSHKEERSFRDIYFKLKKAERRIFKCGIKMDRKVRVILMSDNNFRARDLWLASGIKADSEALENFVSEQVNFIRINNPAEKALAIDKLCERWFFINSVAMQREYGTDIDELGSSRKEQLIQNIQDQRESLEIRLDEPYTRMDYRVYEETCYSFPSAVIWGAMLKTDALHRSVNAFIHEYGHHVFSQLLCSIIKDCRASFFTRAQIASIMAPLYALDELFADYVSISNDFAIVIPLHWAPNGSSSENKRYFSKERTLSRFLDAIENGNEQEKRDLTEIHNILNPCRSLIWKLKLRLGDATMDKLFINSVKKYLIHYVSFVVPNSRLVKSKFGWNCYSIADFQQDARTENLRFLEFLDESARELLSEKDLSCFVDEVKNIFAEEYPLKISFKKIKGVLK